jgi:polyisoprenoid-binding protein YceI
MVRPCYSLRMLFACLKKPPDMHQGMCKRCLDIGLATSLAMSLVVSLVVSFTVTLAMARSSVVIDPAKTRITFDIDAVGWPTTRGVFKSFDGRITVDLEQPEKSAVTFKVNAASVDAGSAGITSYIRSESMLNVAKYPQISFTSTKVVRTGERSVRVTGEMSFFGTTLPASFDVDVEKSAKGKEMAFVAKGTIKRGDYGFISGQPLISDDVRVTVATMGLAE